MIDKNIYRILLITSLTATVIDGTYLGCWKEKSRRKNFDRNPGAIPPGTLSPAICRTLCGGLSYQYAALGSGMFCWCGITAPGVALTQDLTEAKCNMPCEATAEMCGSNTHVNVYEALAPIKLSLGASPNVVATGSAVTFTPSVTTTDTSHKLGFNYDDGAGQTAYVMSGTGLTQRSYYKSGKYNVIAMATSADEELPPVECGAAVKVVTPPSAVIITCPAQMASHEESSCTVTVASGTDMEFQLDYNDGVPVTKSFSISDALDHAVGTPVLINPGVPGVSANTNGLVLLQASQAQYEGTLMGFEYHAATTGSMNAYLYRPNCGSDEYCFETNSCVTTGTCSQTCGGLYCSDVRACCSGAPVRTTGMLPVTYDQIFTTTHTVTLAGHGWLPVTGGPLVKPGDIVGTEASGANVLSVYNAVTNHDYYCNGQIGGPASITSGSCTPTTERHQLQAVYASPSTVNLQFLFTTPGLNTAITATVRSREPSISGSVTDVVYVDVLEGVDQCIIDMPSCIQANVPYTFILQSFTGNGVSILWDFGNTHTITGYTTNDVIYSYPSAGTYILAANISNALSYKASTITLCVEELIKDLSLGSAAAYELGVTSSIPLIMTSGTDYMCTFQIQYEGYEAESQSIDYSTNPPGSMIDYEFTVAGTVTLEIECHNNVGTDSFVTSAKVVERITNVRLEPAGAWPNTEYIITVAWDTGSHVQIDVTIDGVAEPMTISSAENIAVSESKVAAGLGNVYSIFVNAANDLSSIPFTQNFVIDYPLIGVDISCNFLGQLSAPGVDKTIITLGSNVECFVSIADGTSPQIVITYDDGSPDYTHVVGTGLLWTGNEPSFPISHTYTTAQECVMQVTVSNNVNFVRKTYNVVPMVNVAGIILNLDSPPTLCIPPAIIDFSWIVPTLQAPNYVFGRIDWGDNNYDEYEDMNLLDPLQHSYWDKAGLLILNWELWNYAGTESGSLVVEVVTPVLNPILVPAITSGIPNEAIDLVLTIERAPDEGLCSLTFDCDNGDSPFPSLRAANSPFGEDRHTCLYTAKGTYYPTVTIDTTLESVFASCTLEVINPVREADLSIRTNTPIDFEVNQTCHAVFEVDYTDLANPPDYAWISFDFGDGNAAGPFSYSTSHQQLHNYATDGNYITTIHVYNDASEVIMEIESGCYAAITGTTVNIFREPEMPVGAADALGFGPNNDEFRIDEDLKLHVTCTGTLSWWEVSAIIPGGNIFTCNSTETSVVPFSITASGDYTVYVQCKNLIYSGPTITTPITMIEPVGEFSIDDSLIVTNANQPKTFDVTMASYGTRSCVAVNNGQDDVVHLYGDPTTCSVTSVLPWPTMSVAYDPAVDVSAAFQLTYTYNKQRDYALSMYGWNDYSNVQTTFEFSVSDISCTSPNINIVSSHPNFRYPKGYFRSKRIEIDGKVDLTCGATLDNIKQWKLYQWDVVNNVQLAEYPISDLESSRYAELSMSPKYLPYGVYKAAYEVKMGTATTASSAEFKSSVHTFIEVKKSNLVVQLFADSISEISVGPNSLLDIAPEDYSYDPDVESAIGELDVFDYFELSCIDLTNNEVEPEKTVTVTPLDSTVSAPALNLGGCWQDGPGWVSPFTGKLTINTAHLLQLHTYQFHTIGYKDTRSAEFTGKITVLSGDPPEARITFIQSGITAPSSEGKWFNPSAELGLAVDYLSPCPLCTPKWELFVWDHNYVGAPYYGWRPLVYLGRYIEGTTSDELAVHTDLWSHYPGFNNYKAVLQLTNNATGITGTYSVNLRKNNPPYNGNCTIDPLTGTALSTNHTIQCSGFIDDEDDIEQYTIYCNGSLENVKVCGGPNPYWENWILSAGDPDNGDKLQCWVEVTDSLGAIGKTRITDVVSSMASNADLRNQVAGLDLERVEAVADHDQITGYMNAISPALKKLSNDDENQDFRGNGVAVSFIPSGFGDTGRYSSFTSLEPDDAAVKSYQEKRKPLVGAVTKLVDGLDKAKVYSNAKIKVVLSTLATVSDNQAFLRKRSQEKMLKLVASGISNMDQNKEHLSVEDAKLMNKELCVLCQNLQEATVLNANHPSESDIEEQDTAVVNFPVNLHGNTPEVWAAPDEDAEDVLRKGKLVLNTQTQTEFSSTLLNQCHKLKTKSIQILNKIKAKSNEPIEFSTNRVELKMWTSTVANLAGKTVETSAGSVVTPSSVLQNEPPDEPLTFVVEGATSSGAVLTDTLDSAADSRTRNLKVSFFNQDGTEKKIENLKNRITIELKRDQNRQPDNDSALTYADPEVLRDTDIGYMHSVTFTKANSAILIQFLNMTNTTSPYNQFLVLVNYKEKPELTADRSKVLHSCLIPSDTLKTDQECSSTDDSSPTSCFIPGETIGSKTGEWKILVIQLPNGEINKYKGLAYLPSEPKASWIGKRPFYMNYILKTVEVACAYSQSGSSVMDTKGSYPQSVCSGNKIKCQYTHCTSFAGGWVVAPNTIDWDFIFSNADFFKNPTLYITEIVIVVVYILAMIWARRRDRQDLTMLGLAPLLDNDPRDKYYYEVLVSSGMRRNAGTESKVHFILSGEEEETDVRTFSDKKRKIFQRGQTDGFLMAVESSLGALSYLRIWHDNSGKGKMASWYLNHVVVRDVQTDKKYYFIANKWFAVEEDDGQVDRVIPVAGKEQMTEFSYMFSERATKNLSDGHLWFSVVARPPQSRFTRCQRVSCCLCLLYMSMLANAMFYGTENSDNTAYQFGPFAFTPEQIFIGVAANLIIFPVNFLIITLFRKSRPRKLRPSRVEEALKSMPERTTSMTDVNMRVKSSMSMDRPGSSFLIDAKRSESSMSRPESSLSAEASLTKSKKKKKCQLPWWFMIVAWILLWIAVLVSMAFVTFYGIMFQDIKCKKWITSMLVSFFTSVFLTQPIKVFLLAIIFSLIIKNPGGDEEEGEEDEEPTRKLENDEELLHKEDDGYGLTAPTRPMYKPKPPDSKSLEVARVQRMKEIQMWAVIREILFYAFFLWILLVISYKSVSTNSYRYKYNMEKVFIITTNSSHSFSNIKNVESYWVWAQKEMLRGLRAGPYYNNYPAFDMRGYINDKVSRIMGYAVLRQLRVEAGSCKIPYQVDNIIEECNAPYTYSVEQKGDFGPGWTGTVNNSREEYLYRDANSLDGYPFWGEMAMYSGGGYVVKLNKDYTDMVTQLKQLEQEKWIDEYTRAVFLEFTVYNPAINMFSISTMVAEFRPSGGVFPSFRFEPATLLPYMSSVLLFQIICEIIYFLFTCYFVIKEIRAFYKQRLKYFYQFWNIIELCICAMSVSAIVIYFYRLVCINELTDFFRKTQGNEYMKFQYVGYWSEMFSYIIGFLVYFACLKFLKLLRFNKRVSLLADTLKNSAKDLIHFSIIFNIVFLAFIQVFYLIYVARIDTFKTFLSSCEAGIVMMMGKFDIYNMLEVNQWLTQIFLFLFVVTITFIVVNMFLSILNDTFGAVRNNMNKQSNDYEIVEFMMSRFKLWTGLGRDGNTTINPADLEKERRRNNNTLEGKIDYFPDQIDRFLASISHMYMEKSKFDDFLHKGAYGKMAMKAQKFGPSMHPTPKPGSTRLSDGARGMTDVHTD